LISRPGLPRVLPYTWALKIQTRLHENLPNAMELSIEKKMEER
jgi:hypothetical protein